MEIQCIVVQMSESSWLINTTSKSTEKRLLLMSDLKLLEEIGKRRTFAIISHPDAGKTTITEKVLLFGRALQTAGTVKGKKSGQHAKSDWMEMEKERGISVTTSVMQFPYNDHLVNLLDTPGHEDFSEDTYRTPVSYTHLTLPTIYSV